jgi:hypothetical protein
MVDISSADLKLKLPFGAIIAGPSSSGKTELCQRLVDNRQVLFEPPPLSVLYAYGQFNKMVTYFESIDGVHTVQGAPSDALIRSLPKPALVILDDLMYDVDERWLANLYTKRSHHENFGVIMLVQNLFDRKVKVPRLNSMYLFLMRAPNSLLTVRNIGSHLWPRQLPFFMDAYRKATSANYGYLLIDMHPSSLTEIRLRTSIFPGEPTELFVPKAGVDLN